MNLTYVGEVELTYQPLCDAAVMLRPLIIALGMFLAFIIVANAIREGGT